MRRAFSRSRSDGTATTASVVSSSISASEETRIVPGNFTPGRNRLFSPASSSNARSAGVLASSVTRRPSAAITMASVVPQVVAPTTTGSSDKEIPQIPSGLGR